MLIWKTLCAHYFQRLVGEDKVILDLNPDTPRYLGPDVEFHACPADKIDVESGSIDVVFVSNFLEHLKTKEECDAVLAEVRRVLKGGGRFVIMGPNIRYLAAEYWDFYDHYLPLSHLSLAEGLVQAGYDVTTIIPRFLPYTTRSALPRHPLLIALYLKIPLVWRIFGKQFPLVGEKPA
jgi:SAM-dependent methyltransferase